MRSDARINLAAIERNVARLLQRDVERTLALGGTTGTVSVASFGVDLGADPDEELGARVPLIGAAGDERIRAEDLAARQGGAGDEITCAIDSRVRRVHHRDGEPQVGPAT